MRGRWLVVLLLLIGCSQNHLDVGQRRDGQTPSPTDDAAADVLAATGQLDGVDRSPGSDGLDGFLAADGSSSCTPLAATALPDPSVTACPATEATAACAASDVGAVVARSEECIGSWGAIPFQCSYWPIPPAGQEFVVLTVSDCSFGIYIESVLACADHIEIDYIESGTCSACDGMHSTMRMFSLPLDVRPVIASGRIEMPPCILP